jgi:hypothetical protein
MTAAADRISTGTVLGVPQLALDDSTHLPLLPGVPEPPDDDFFDFPSRRGRTKFFQRSSCFIRECYYLFFPDPHDLDPVAEIKSLNKGVSGNQNLPLVKSVSIFGFWI